MLRPIKIRILQTPPYNLIYARENNMVKRRKRPQQLREALFIANIADLAIHVLPTQSLDCLLDALPR
jgi:hypothetical protein